MFRLPDTLTFYISITIVNPTREEFLRNKFYKRLNLLSNYNPTEYIQTALTVLTPGEVLIIEHPIHKDWWIQCLKTDKHYELDFMITPQTWDNSSYYWRLRTQLEKLKFKPLKITDTDSIWEQITDLYQYKYSWSETSTQKHVYSDLGNDPKVAGRVLHSCFCYMYQVKPEDVLEIEYVSNKFFWI